ncbi:MAG: glutamine--fructose-6-phosphate transaminase (isomerizing) [Candidatus Micrarchaeota archaeon]|nr:glutamine--fructose-6-phosphate transaminase (isomerizing) [Candidatus Micrarchaeota archaeon]
MCGIIGYVGQRRAAEVLTHALKHLEYRGYDSVGIAVKDGSTITVRKDKGMVDEVSKKHSFLTMGGSIGIGHTRWATHGVPCQENSHPHFDCTKNIVLVHNGVIENFQELKEDVLKKGHKFTSETDSEIVAHMLEDNLKSNSDVLSVMSDVVNKIHGSYSFVVMAGNKKELYLARKNSPLVIGIGKGEMFCASDIPALLPYTSKFVQLEEGDLAVLSETGYNVLDHNRKPTTRKEFSVNWNIEMAQKGGYEHFMLKEIHDQGHFITESLASDTTSAKKLLDKYSRIDIVAAGTSYHAGLLFAILLQREGKNAQAFIASDYPFVAVPTKNTLVVAISQSGETADVLQSIRFVKSKSAKILSITNVVGSTITNLSDEVVYLNTGPEIGVAATKTFTAELAVIYKLMFAKERLSSIKNIFEKMLESESEVKSVAAKLKNVKNAFFIARGISVPIAQEGSLKFKEITYIHSEAYPGGELKHGTLSLIEEGIPVIVIAPKDETSSKIIGNLKEAKTRGALIISITNDENIRKESDISISIPTLDDPVLYPFAMIIPLQLLAYYVSTLRGINPDKPRNLAKSVTVE